MSSKEEAFVLRVVWPIGFTKQAAIAIAAIILLRGKFLLRKRGPVLLVQKIFGYKKGVAGCEWKVSRMAIWLYRKFVTRISNKELYNY